MSVSTLLAAEVRAGGRGGRRGTVEGEGERRGRGDRCERVRRVSGKATGEGERGGDRIWEGERTTVGVGGVMCIGWGGGVRYVGLVEVEGCV